MRAASCNDIYEEHSPSYRGLGFCHFPEIREDLRVKYGAPEIGDTWDTLEPYLKVIKENEPDMVPFAINPNGGINLNEGWNCVPVEVINPGETMVGAAVTDVFGVP